MNDCADKILEAEKQSGARMKAASIDADGSIHIWLVDDNADCRDLLASLLGAEQGFECPRQFPSAETALAALAREPPPDVILLDVRMPGLGGLDALRPMKSLARTTRVLMMTTFYDSHSRNRALRDGACDLLLKSWPIAEISERIRQAVDHGAEVAVVEESPDFVVRWS